MPINKTKALEIFKDHLDWLENGWEKDGFLKISEIKNTFYEKAPITMLQNVAREFGCSSLDNTSKRYWKYNLLGCMPEADNWASQLSSPFVNLIGIEQLNRTLAEVNTSKPTILIFWSRNCPHCIEEKSEITSLAFENANIANYIAIEYPYPMQKENNVYKVRPELAYLEPNINLAKKFGVNGFPTIIILQYKKGKWSHKELDRQFLFLSIDLRKYLEKL